MKRTLILLTALLILWIGMNSLPRECHALDPPHNAADTDKAAVVCSRCHYSLTATPSWANQIPPPDTTKMNLLCADCHNPLFPKMSDEYKYIVTHSSYETSTRYGTWLIECRACHHPHYQAQVRSYPADTNSYIVSGGTVLDIVTGAASTVTVSNALSACTYTNYLFVPNTAYPSYMYRITGNTENAVIVAGKINLAYAGAGKPYVIKYGNMVKNKIYTQSSGTRTVKFFKREGQNSFADGDATVDGVCQVCHTDTKYFKTDGTLDVSGPNTHPTTAGVNCTACHSHNEGFRASCTSCHGMPPVAATLGGPDGLAEQNSDGGTGATTPGAHQKHVITLGYPCETCHTEGMPVSPISNDKKIQIGFDIINGAYQSGTYNGRASLINGYSYTSGNAGTTITNSGAMTCANIYCHSNVQGAGGIGGPSSFGIPAWDNSASVQCGACHKADGTGDGSRMDSGSHTEHVSPSTFNFSCSTCHSGAGSGASVHLNNVINITLNSSYGGAYNGSNASPDNHAPGQGYGTCSNVYCHSSAQGITDPTQPPSYATPTWGQAFSGTCRGECHATGYAHPTDSGYNQLTSGGHAKHLSYKFDQDGNCQSCHYDPGYATCTNCHNRSLHVNKNIEVVFNPDFPTAVGGESGSYLGDSVPGTAYGSCSALYCHSPGTKGSPPYDDPTITTITWGGASLPTDCTGCHYGDNNAVNKISTGSHLKHIENYDCVNCHKDTVSNSRTLNPQTYSGNLTYGYRYHVNGWLNIRFSGISPSGSYAGQSSPINYRVPGSAYGNCSNLYCHSDGTSVSSGTISANTSPNWGSGTLACNACHGNPPGYPNLNPKANTHATHGYMTCEKCHWATTQTGSTISDYTKHVNIAYDVLNSTGTITYAYNTGGGSCSGAFGCHGDATWGGPMPPHEIYSNCVSCHNASMGSRRQVVDSNGDGTGTGGDFNPLEKTSHHYYTASGTITNLDCQVCHDVSQHPGGRVRLKNVDNPGEVYIYDSANPSTAENHCLSCHDIDGAGASGGLTPFSDGKILGSVPYKMSREIGTHWAKTYGHKQQGLTCLGNGNPNTGCHSNGHGSDYVGLLSRNLTLPTTTAGQGAPYETDDEGAYELCFNCHQSYPRVTKEAILGVKAGSNYDWDHWWGVMPPYYIASTQTNFKDRYDGSAKFYDDQEGWRGPGDYYNLHYFHLQDRNWWTDEGGWKYRDSIDSGEHCLTCHNVHGSNTQWGWVYDEMLYTHDTPTPAAGDHFGKIGLSDLNALDNYPISCAYNCHPMQGTTHNWFEPSGE